VLLRGGTVTTGGASYVEDMSEDTFATALAENVYTPDLDNPFRGRRSVVKQSVTKQLKEQKKLRKLLLSSFNAKLQKLYSRFIFALGKIASVQDLQISNVDLEKLILWLSYFADSQPDRKNFHIALSGFRRDATSRSVKYIYLETLRTIHELLSAHSSSPALKELRIVIGEIIKTVDEFNDAFVNTLGKLRAFR
jgi:hypothetical protein